MFVYLLKNNTNGKLYVGQTTRDINDRFKDHVKASRSDKSRSKMAITMAIHKYGWSGFSKFVLEVCENQSDLDSSEIFWIERMKSVVPLGYNVRAGGSGGKCSESTKQKLSIALSGRPKSEDTKRKISEAAMLRDNERLRTLRLGVLNSPETREKMSQTRTGMTLSQRAKEKLSIANSGTKNVNSKLTPELIYEIKLRYENEDTSQLLLAKEYGVSQGTISKALREKSYVIYSPSISLPFPEATLPP